MKKLLYFYKYIKSYFTHNTPMQFKKKSKMFLQGKWYRVSYLYKINIKNQMVLDEVEIVDVVEKKTIYKPKLKVRKK